MAVSLAPGRDDLCLVCLCWNCCCCCCCSCCCCCCWSCWSCCCSCWPCCCSCCCCCCCCCCPISVPFPAVSTNATARDEMRRSAGPPKALTLQFGDGSDLGRECAPSPFERLGGTERGTTWTVQPCLDCPLTVPFSLTSTSLAALRVMRVTVGVMRAFLGLADGSR
jgi:hypothetical protein